MAMNVQGNVRTCTVLLITYDLLALHITCMYCNVHASSRDRIYILHCITATRSTASPAQRRIMAAPLGSLSTRKKCIHTTVICTVYLKVPI